MNKDKLKRISLLIVFLVFFSTTANAFTLFDDITPSFGISACDTDDDAGSVDETPFAYLPLPTFTIPAPLQAVAPTHPSEVIIPVQFIPFLNHISRAPPFSLS